MRALAATSILLTTLCVGCARFEPRPLSARDRQRLDSRTCQFELKEFLQREPSSSIAQWPTPGGILEILTPDRFLHHPSLGGRRRPQQSSETSRRAGRPKPAVTHRALWAASVQSWFQDLSSTSLSKRPENAGFPDRACLATKFLAQCGNDPFWTVQVECGWGCAELAAAQLATSCSRTGKRCRPVAI